MAVKYSKLSDYKIGAILVRACNIFVTYYKLYEKQIHLSFPNF